MAVKERLVILDMHAILHRAYHALPDFSSSKGEPTGALYGLVSMLVRIMVDLKPDHVVATYDLPKPTHRHIAYEEYKSHRPKTDDALVSQILRSRDVLDAFSIPRYECEGFEADDLIGTIVERLKKTPGIEIVIASGDMDTLQLVAGKRVRVFTLKKGLSDTILYDEDGVIERYGFPPRYVPDYKGLYGDPSDNIPGVKGIGDKTASLLISKFGSLDSIYKMLKKDPKKLLDVGIKEGMLQKLKEQEEGARFSKLLAEIRGDAPMGFSIPKVSWRQEVQPDRVMDLLSELDFRSLMPRVRELLGLEKGPPQPKMNERSEKIYAEEDVEKATLAVWVLDSSLTTPSVDDVFRLGRSKDLKEAYTNILTKIKESGLDLVLNDIEVPLMPVLRGMEERGIRIDRNFLTELSRTYHKELDSIAGRIYGSSKGPFNINSPKQLGEVLFDRLGLSFKNQKKTSSGARSTRESELEKMRDMHPIIVEVLSYRELQKLLSTYIDNIPTLLDGQDRLHTSYIQTGTTTGRLASQNPNLQNIPIKSELGRAIRHAFIADPGSVFVSFDYSQIELRIAAFLSRDEVLTRIFTKGRDVHAEVAAQVFGIELPDVTYEQRRQAKIVNFGILYGMGVTSLKEALGTTRAEAQRFYDEYFQAFPQLAAFIDETKIEASRNGYTRTYFGRRRYFDGIHSPIPYVRASSERMAINAPIQGTQADIVKLAMVRIDAWSKKEGLGDKIRMLLQVHDELLFEVDEDVVDKCTGQIREIMENVIPVDERRGVPFIAEGKIGKDWGDMRTL